MALLIDKINYTSDKNVLETMPGSVTQEEPARRLFQLLGYYPKWYRSAKVNVALQWLGDDTVDKSAIQRLTLDDFISITDEDTQYVYTITTQGVSIPTNGQIQTVEAIEGKINDLSINGNNLITIDMLDSDLRVYIQDYNVAENGIFIFNDIGNGTLGAKWNKVDNVSIQDLNQRIFSFNIDQITKQCYIQFPDDIISLIDGGLRIKYITSVGSQGSINTGILNKTYSTYNAHYLDDSAQDISINLNTDNLYITNTALISAGYDPETINEMYRNYKKIVGTFDTLVTLRDYSNAFYNSQLCSNDFVCDRTNDIQKSYKILTENEDGNNQYTYVQYSAADDQTDEDISPFDLKVYALQFNDLCNEDVSVNTLSASNLDLAYAQTFWLFDDYKVDEVGRATDYQKLLDYVYTQKCIQHDFQSLQENKIALVKNEYSIDCKIIPTSTLSAVQIDEVKLNIKKAIYKNFNSRKVDFGEEVSYSDLLNTIQDSDARIKYAILNSPEYHTYVMYYSKDEEVKQSNTYKLEIHFLHHDGHSITMDTNDDTFSTELIDIKRFFDYGSEFHFDIDHYLTGVGDNLTHEIESIQAYTSDVNGSVNVDQFGKSFIADDLSYIHGTMPQTDLTYMVTYTN